MQRRQDTDEPHQCGLDQRVGQSPTLAAATRSFRSTLRGPIANGVLDTQKGAKKRLERMRGRFSAKSGENRIEGMLDWQQDYVGKKIATLTREIADMTRAKEILAGYRYDAREPIFPGPMGHIFYSRG